MGIEYNALKSLSLLKKIDKDVKSVATIGRQSIQIKPGKIKDIKISKKDIDILKKEQFAEKLFNIMGFNPVHSYDFSNYEDADFIHDMNIPINDEHKNRYDLVFDGGSLEHIFNFPIAIKNCMEMVKVNGYFISVTTCNNFSGHGFYQFSPELFFRIFNENNGFEMIGVYIGVKNKWYKVNDPEQIKERVTFKNNTETYITVIAKKIDKVEIFKETPQQSDYVECWKKEDDKKMTYVNKIIRKTNRVYNKLFTKYNKKYFKKIK